MGCNSSTSKYEGYSSEAKAELVKHRIDDMEWCEPIFKTIATKMKTRGLLHDRRFKKFLDPNTAAIDTY